MSLSMTKDIHRILSFFFFSYIFFKKQIQMISFVKLTYTQFSKDTPSV